MPCYSPLKGYKDEETGGIKFRRENTKETMEVACGQCLGCRLDRSRMWAIRMVHEAGMPENFRGNHFITLTYDPDKIPESWSLDKTHIQKFIKRLRKKKSIYVNEKGDVRRTPHPEYTLVNPIKYYYCGEYGNRCKHGFDLSKQQCPLCNVGRPHFHICMFNLELSDIEPYSVQNGETRYTSQEIEDTWTYGFVDVGGLTVQSAGYVARYILKKVTGEKAEGHYQRITEEGEIIELEPEFAHMSNGIGAGWYEKYKKDVFPSDEVPVPTVGVMHKAPRFYEEKYKKEDPIGHELLKQKRIKYKRENEEEFTPERLWSKYRVKQAATSMLAREI